MFCSNFPRSFIILLIASIAVFSQPSYKDPNNLIKNGGFDNGTANWTNLLSHQGKGTSSVVDGQMVCVFTSSGVVPGKEFYDDQLIQENLTIVNGVTYIVTLDAKADVVRTFQFAVENQNEGTGFTQYAKVGDVNPRDTLATTMKTFSRTFTMTLPTDNQVRLSFSFGLTPSTVTFDNISIIDKSKVGVIGQHPLIPVGSEFSPMIAADSRGISFRISNPAHFQFRICSPSGRLVAGSSSVNHGSASHYRIEFPTLGISSGTYILQAFDGKERYSKVFLVMP
jgi:hypothetical protein